MTETTTTEPTQTQQAPAPVRGVDDPSTPPMVRPQGLIDEAKRWKAEAETANAKIAKYEADRKAAEDEALKKSGDKDALIADREKKIAELETATRAAELRARRESARALLIGRNVVDPLAQEGALTLVPPDGEFDAAQWAEEMAQKYPASFTVPKAAPKPGVGGTVSSNAGGSLDERLKSQDPSVLNGALKEASAVLFRSVSG